MSQTNTREHQSRKADLWNRRPDLSEREVEAELAAEIALEQAQQAEIDERSRQMAVSLDAMFRCGACGADVVGRALCADCSRVEQVILNERALTENRKELVTAWLAKVGR